MSNLIELQAIVKGRVQGVGFRWTVVECAEKFDLKGTVQNLSNGTVEIIAQGKRTRLDEFLVYLKANSGFARIDSVSARYFSAKDSFISFKVL